MLYLLVVILGFCGFLWLARYPILGVVGFVLADGVAITMSIWFIKIWSKGRYVNSDLTEE